MKRKFVVFVTVDNDATAQSISKSLVGEQLAACVNIISGVRSIYKWKGEMMDESELLMIIKTTENNFEKLEKRIIEIHPYDVPEIIGIAIDEGHEPYLNWIENETI